MTKKTLLMIDNDAYYAGIYANRFEAAGWKVSVEDDIDKAMKRLTRQVPDVVIIDVHPADEAIEFLKRLREDPKTAGVLQIALTSLGDRPLMNRVLDAGVDSYLLKGHFVPAEAVKKVMRLLEEKSI
jgi:DNA-binding response OmpR family regulator